MAFHGPKIRGKQPLFSDGSATERRPSLPVKHSKKENSELAVLHQDYKITGPILEHFHLIDKTIKPEIVYDEKKERYQLRFTLNTKMSNFNEACASSNVTTMDLSGGDESGADLNIRENLLPPRASTPRRETVTQWTPVAPEQIVETDLSGHIDDPLIYYVHGFQDSSSSISLDIVYKGWPPSPSNSVAINSMNRSLLNEIVSYHLTCNLISINYRCVMYLCYYRLI